MGTVRSPTDPDRVFEDDDTVGVPRVIGQTDRDLSMLPPQTGPKQGLMTTLMGLFGYGAKPTPLSGVEDDVDPTGGSDASNWFEQTFSLSSDRSSRYDVFDEMDTFDLPRSVLDAYAEETTQPDQGTGQIVSITTNDGKVKEAFKGFVEAIKLEDRATQIARNMTKYGDDPFRLIYSGGVGIQGMKRVPPKHFRRHEDKFDRLIGFSQQNQVYRGERKHTVSWPWDYLHFRLLGGDSDIYGTSLLTGWFRPWRQLCVSAGTLVWTDRGPVKIEDLQPGEQTYCHNYETGETFETPVVAVLKMGLQPLVRITTRHRSIDVTPNHGMLVRQSDGTFTYKKAEEIIARDGKDGPADQFDQLVLPTIDYGPDQHVLQIDKSNYYVHLDTAYVNKGLGGGVMDRIRSCGTRTASKNVHAFLAGKRPLRADDFDKVSKSFGINKVHCSVTRRGSRARLPFGSSFQYACGLGFARFIGFMLGDGWTGPNHVGFALGVDDKQNEHYIRLAQDLFNQQHYTETDAIEGVRGGAVKFNSATAKDIMDTAGFVTGFADKRIPEWVFSMSREFREEVLRGLCDADGGHQTDGVTEGYRLTLANKTLVEQTWTLAQSVGWRVSPEIAEIDRPDRQLAYRIWLSEKDPTDSTEYEAVLSVEPIGEGQTYDLQVEHDLHNFTANGVVSHNTLAEDATLIYRLRRAPDRNMIMVDVGDMDPVDQVAWMNRWRKRFRKTELIDPASPQYRKQYNPLTPIEDLFMPITQNSQTRVESLAGTANVGEIYDIEYYLNKFFGAARAPKAYFGFEGEVNAKATLMQQDIRFARTIKRIQKGMVLGIRHGLNIHLALTGTPVEQNKFVIELASVSMLEEMERMEALTLRNQVVDAMANWAQTMQVDSRVWSTFLLINYAKLPEELVLKLIRKTPDKPAEMGGMESADNGLSKEGYYELTEKEQIAIGEMVHSKPGVRRSLSRLAELYEDDIQFAKWESQVDRSITMLREGDREQYRDSVTDDPEAAMLMEHLTALNKNKK